MIVVTITGVPKSIKMVRFSAFLRKNILRKKNAHILVTRAFSDFHVQFKSDEDAHIVNKTLQNFEFKHKDDTHILQSYINNNDASIINADAFTKTEDNFHDWKRSPSPKYALNESSDNIEEVNKAIELTRRKRILLEEERKLLLEQKKLSLVKASNPTSIDELEHLDNICDHASYATIDNMLAKAKKRRVNNGKDIYKIRQKIFFQMNEHFHNHISPENSYAMKKIAFKKLTGRIQALLKNKPPVSKQELLCLYRLAYPVTGDEDFILDLIKTAPNNDDKSNNPQTDSKVSENRYISELSEIPSVTENDLDDWIDDDSSKVPSN